MTYATKAEAVTSDNQASLKTLIRAITYSQGDFSILIARCNYQSLQERMAEQLREQCPVPISEIHLEQSVKTLYTTIAKKFCQAQPQALMVFGLESVTDLEQVLRATNQVREEFRHFSFPVVLWMSDQVLHKLIRLAPDFESWATSVEFAIATNELINLLEQTTDQAFLQVFAARVSKFINNAALNFGLSANYQTELESARDELLHRNVGLPQHLEASVEFIFGLWADQKSESRNKARQHYEQSLNLWQQALPELERFLRKDIETGAETEHFSIPLRYQPTVSFSPRQNSPSKLEKLGCVLFQLGLWWRTYALRYPPEQTPACDKAKEYLQRCLEAFELAQRPDLKAKFINALGDILQRLGHWDELEIVAQQSLELNTTYAEASRQAQAYGLLAEAELSRKAWEQAQQSVLQALHILAQTEPSTQPTVLSESSTSLDRLGSEERGWYLFLLARAQQELGQKESALRNLETARSETKPEYDPELYIRILAKLHQAYFEQGNYLTAFNYKQKRLSVEQRFGFRAFIGAGRLQPNQRFTCTTKLSQGQDQRIAQEIKASGRLQDVNRLVKRMGRNDHKLTVIYGSSGVGKSSTVHAGLIPALKQTTIDTRNVLPILQRVYSEWERELGKSLAEALAERQNHANLQEATENTSPLANNGQPKGNFASLEDILKQLRKNASNNLLTVFIFDQFEEFFFVCQQPSKRLTFYNFLGKCLDIPYVKVILSLREDYLHYLLECNRFQGLEVINNNILDKSILYYIGNFSGDEAYSVIKSLTEQTHFYLEPALIDQLVKDLADELGQVHPIEMQVVGAQLQTEKIITLEQYQRLGANPKQKLVERYLAEVAQDCGADNRHIAQMILFLLTNENNTRPLKTRSELVEELPREDGKKIDLVLEIFVKSGLVLYLLGSSVNLYQLVHDYLVAFIRQQQDDQIRAKLAQAKEQERLLQETQEQKRRSDAWLSRSLKVLTGSVILGVLLLFSTILAVKFWLKTRNSEITALSRYSQALYASNQDLLDPLIPALQAGVRRKRAIIVEPETTTLAINALQQTVYGVREYNRLQGHLDGVRGVSFSPDGQTIATAGDDKTVILWNQQGKKLQTLEGHLDGVRSVSFSPDGELIATASFDRTVKLWNKKGEELQTLTGFDDGVWSVRFSPDGENLATASEGGTVILWSLQGEEAEPLLGHEGAVLELNFSPDGETLATASFDGTVNLWSVAGKFLKTTLKHQAPVFSVSFSPDGQLIATASKDGSIKLSKLDGSLQKSWKAHENTVTSIRFSPDGKLLASGSADRSVKLWNLQGQELETFAGHDNIVWSVAFSRDSQTLASASSDGSVRLWSSYGSELPTPRGDMRAIFDVSFSPDGKTIATASQENTIQLWDISSKMPLLKQTLTGHKDVVWSVAFSRDSQTLASASSDQTIKLWNLQGQELKTLKGHQDVVRSVSFSPDGQLLASAARDNTIKLWNLEGQELKTLRGHQDWVFSVGFSPDGKTLASASKDKTIKLWNLEGQELRTLKGHDGWVTSVNFSPDGQTLASASEDKTIKLWSKDGQLIKTFTGHENTVWSVRFSPDGQTLVSASDDKTIKFWNQEDELIKTFTGHDDGVKSLSFSEDGQNIASSDAFGKVIIWNWHDIEDLNGLVKRGCRLVGDYLKNNPKVEDSSKNLCS
ncbi:MAG: hypothetical protein WA919_16425 [Coleofasciculaceae cyanobacterium]